MTDYKEDHYFLKYQDKIIEILQFYHDFSKYKIFRHYRHPGMDNLEYDVLITTPKLRIGIEIKDYANVFKVFEQALKRLNYVDYQYVLIGFKNSLDFDLGFYLDIAKYYKNEIEDFFRIGVILASEELNYVYLFKRAFKKDKANGILKYLNLLAELNEQ